jgi:cytochrome P450
VGQALITTFFTAQVMKESLALYSPLSFLYREAVADVDLDNGYILPAGTPIIVTAYLTHQNPEHFPDPDRFLPENSVGRQPFAYIPFGLGRRLFVGHYYAKMETKTILSTVLRR